MPIKTSHFQKLPHFSGVLTLLPHLVECSIVVLMVIFQHVLSSPPDEVNIKTFRNVVGPADPWLHVPDLLHLGKCWLLWSHFQELWEDSYTKLFSAAAPCFYCTRALSDWTARMRKPLRSEESTWQLGHRNYLRFLELLQLLYPIFAFLGLSVINFNSFFPVYSLSHSLWGIHLIPELVRPFVCLFVSLFCFIFLCMRNLAVGWGDLPKQARILIPSGCSYPSVKMDIRSGTTLRPMDLSQYQWLATMKPTFWIFCVSAWALSKAICYRPAAHTKSQLTGSLSTASSENFEISWDSYTPSHIKVNQNSKRNSNFEEG